MEQQILDGTDRLKRITSQGGPLFQENFLADWQSGNFYTGKKKQKEIRLFSRQISDALLNCNFTS